MAKSKDTKPAAKSAAKPAVRSQVSAEDLPRKSLEEARVVLDAVYRNYPVAGANWDSIAKLCKVNPTHNMNKYPLWSAVAYGMLEKTEENIYKVGVIGRKIVAPEYPGEDVEGKVKALLTPRLLSRFFTEYNGNQFPEEEHFPHILENRFSIPRERVNEAIQLIRANAAYAGVVTSNSDGKSVIRLEGIPSAADFPTAIKHQGDQSARSFTSSDRHEYDWAKVLFYITPIGDEGSEPRKHADMMLKHVLLPAAKSHGLEVIRADKIDKPGLITKQIFDQLVNARVCVADLSFSNPNVFYELGVRHTCKLPTIQLVRKGDKIPFDVGQGRTILVDVNDVYSVTDRLNAAQEELSEHIRHLLDNSSAEPGDDNPLHVYLPKLRTTMT